MSVPDFLNTAHRAAADTMIRAADLGLARPSAYVTERLLQRATIQSETQRMTAIAELLNRTLQDFTCYVYDPLPSGKPSGFDPFTGIVAIPAPFTTTSYKRWGLRRSEQAIMMGFMRNWQARPKLPAIYLYAPTIRRWLVNTSDYPTIAEAGPIVAKGLFFADIIAQIERKIHTEDLQRTGKRTAKSTR